MGCQDSPGRAAAASRSSRRYGVLGLALSLFVAPGDNPAVATDQPPRAEVFQPPQQRSLLGATGVPDGTLGSVGGIRYEVKAGFAVTEGDMVLGTVDRSGRLRQSWQQRGLGQSSLFGRWPHGIITYRFSDDMPEDRREKVREAIDQINELTRFRILERTPELAARYSDHIVFERDSGCASYVGRGAGNEGPGQPVWIGPLCTVGSIVHELAHAIGLFHEHTRDDRDEYIQVLDQNIRSGKSHNFEVLRAGVTRATPYDYGSIMHYGEYFFSTDPLTKKTIRAPVNVEIGQRERLSELDIEAIDTMYATDLSLHAQTHEVDEVLETDVVVSNLGSLGANQLELRVTFDESTEWVSISSGSGWFCESHGPELHCLREVLDGEATTRFSLRASAEAAPEDLRIRLDSLTLDTNTANNALNDDGRWGSPDSDSANGGTGNEALPSGSGGIGDDATDNNGEPAPQGTEPRFAAAQSDAGGGGAGGGLAALLVALLYSRKHGRRRRQDWRC